MRALISLLREALVSSGLCSKKSEVSLYKGVDGESERQLNKFSACVIFRRDSQLMKSSYRAYLEFDAWSRERARTRGERFGKRVAVPFQRLNVLDTSLESMSERGGSRCCGRCLRGQLEAAKFGMSHEPCLQETMTRLPVSSLHKSSKVELCGRLKRPALRKARWVKIPGSRDEEKPFKALKVKSLAYLGTNLI
jgi:hypothetical protein